jgi:hypothetical protein
VYLTGHLLSLLNKNAKIMSQNESVYSASWMKNSFQKQEWKGRGIRDMHTFCAAFSLIERIKMNNCWLV